MKKQKQAVKVPAVIKRRLTIVPLILVCAVGIGTYWNSFDVPLVFDDILTIQRNAGVQFGDYLNLTNIFGRSVLYFTFALNYYFGGQNVWGYHLINLLLHLTNGILVYFIGRQLFLKAEVRSPQITLYSGLAAAVFLAHPIQTESVAY